MKLTLEELGEAVRAIIPTAVFDEQVDGGLIIYTGLTVNENDELVEHSEAN